MDDGLVDLCGLLWYMWCICENLWYICDLWIYMWYVNVYVLIKWRKRKRKKFYRFAECNDHGTRQRQTLFRVSGSQHSTKSFCRVSEQQHSATEELLPSVRVTTLGNGGAFAECQRPDTRQRWRLCRVSKATTLGNGGVFAESQDRRHSAKNKTLPSVGRLTLGKAWHLCRESSVRHSAKKGTRQRRIRREEVRRRLGKALPSAEPESGSE